MRSGRGFNPSILFFGMLAIGLLIVAGETERSGYLGSYIPNRGIHGVYADWKPPALTFKSAGCCTDDIRGARWHQDRFTVITESGEIQLRIGQTTSREFWIPGGADVLGLATACGRVWVPETKRERLLEIFPDGSQNTIVGSNVAGSVNAVAIASANPLTLIMTTSARSGNDEFLVQQALPSNGGSKLYLSRSAPSPPVLVQWIDNGSPPTPVDIGEGLWEPSGIAVSTDGNTLYVADERGDELAWLRIVRSGNGWLSQGKMAQFALGDSPRGIVRGLAVFRYHGSDIVAGSTPDGLAFYLPDGRSLGTIETKEAIGRLAVIPGRTARRDILYAVAGRSIWLAVLRDVEPPVQFTCPAVQKTS